MKTSEFIVRIEHPEAISTTVIADTVYAAIGRVAITRSLPNSQHIKSVKVTTSNPKKK